MKIEMVVERKNLFAMINGERITAEVPIVFVLVEGEILIEHQTCGTCRPKTTMLNKLGTQKTLEAETIYRVKNNTMARSAYLAIYPEINQSD